jgi:hypothetical protein
MIQRFEASEAIKAVKFTTKTFDAICNEIYQRIRDAVTRKEVNLAFPVTDLPGDLQERIAEEFRTAGYVVELTPDNRSFVIRWIIKSYPVYPPPPPIETGYTVDIDKIAQEVATAAGVFTGDLYQAIVIHPTNTQK